MHILKLLYQTNRHQYQVSHLELFHSHTSYRLASAHPPKMMNYLHTLPNDPSLFHHLNYLHFFSILSSKETVPLDIEEV